MILFCLSLIEGIGYETRQTSKEQILKDAKIYVGWSTTVYNFLFCFHICLSYVIKIFVLARLVPGSVVDNSCVL